MLCRSVGKRKILLIALLLTLLVSALAGTLFVELGTAQSFVVVGPDVPPPNPAAINILNPQNHTSYRVNSVPLRVSVSVSNLSDIFSILCYLDGRQITKPGGATFNVFLTDLSEGAHTIRVSVSNQKILNWVWQDPFSSPPYADVHDIAYSDVVHSESLVSFTVDNTSPQVSVSSPQNDTYGVASVPLEFIVDESVLQLVYSLNGNSNVTISGNTTLSGLSIGDHNVTVYAWDEGGNVGASEPVIFTVAIPESESETFPTTLIIAIVVLVSVVTISAGLLFYFRKRRHRGLS